MESNKDFNAFGQTFNRRPKIGLKIQDVEEGSGVKVLAVDMIPSRVRRRISAQAVTAERRRYVAKRHKSRHNDGKYVKVEKMHLTRPI